MPHNPPPPRGPTPTTTACHRLSDPPTHNHHHNHQNSDATALYHQYEPLGWQILPWLLIVADAFLSVLIVKRVPCKFGSGGWWRVGRLG